MREIYRRNNHDNAILRLIAAELSLRKTKTARLLRQEILKHLKSAGESPSTVITMDTEPSRSRASNFTTASRSGISADDFTRDQVELFDCSPDDTTDQEGTRAKIKVMVKRILRKHGYPPDLQDEATKTVLAQAELLCADWPFLQMLSCP